MKIKRKLSEGVKKEKGVILCQKERRKVSKGNKKQLHVSVKRKQEFWEKREEAKGRGKFIHLLQKFAELR